MDQIKQTLDDPEIPQQNKNALNAYADERLQEDDEFIQEDDRLWGAVREAQEYLKNPKKYLEDIDREANQEEEIERLDIK